MPAIDHLVLPVHDLATARGAYEALGFRVAPDARHPFGTGNACVFFANRTYLEPLAVVDLAAARAAAGNVFVGRARRFLGARGEGFAMVALRSRSAEADHARFQAERIAEGGLFRFSREAARPDGTTQTIGVSLAVAGIADAPDALLFACEHIGPTINDGTFLTNHPNGAEGVIGVTAVASNPADFHAYLSAATGVRELRATSFAVETRLADAGDGEGGAMLRIVSREGFAARYRLPAPDPQAGLLFAAIDIRVADLAAARRFAPDDAIADDGRLIVPPGPGRAAVIAFEARS